LDQMEQRLEAILSDPSSMNRIMELAKGLGLDPASAPFRIPQTADAQPSGSSQTVSSPPASSGGGGSAPPANQLTSLLSAMGGQITDDKQTSLLKALRPYLRPERQERLDRAIQTAKMVRLAKQAMQQFTP